EEMEETGVGNSEDGDGRTIWMELGRDSPDEIAANKVEKRVEREPDGQRGSVGKSRQGGKQQGDLRGIHGDIKGTRRFRHSLAGKFSLDGNVVEVRTVVLVGQSSKDIEVEKVSPFEQAVAVEQSPSRDEPCIGRPEAE